MPENIECSMKWGENGTNKYKPSTNTSHQQRQYKRSVL